MRDHASLPTEGREFPLRPNRARIIRFSFSLLIALLLWGWVSELSDPFITVNYRELDIVPGELDDSLQIITTLPRASVTLRGPESRLSKIQRNDITVTLDTTEVDKAGDYRLKLIVTTPDGPTERSSDPRELAVTVDEEVTQVMPIEVRRIVPDGDRRDITGITPETTQVTLSGPSSAMNRVHKVVLPVTIDNHSSSFDETFTPYAVDTRDQRVSEVEVLPGQIKTRVELKTRGKRISVIPEVRGVPAEGYSMRQRSALPDSVIVDGPDEALESLLFVNTEPVDISNATRSISKEVGLVNLPSGVTVIEPASGQVEVRVAVEDTSGTAQTLAGLPVEIINLDPTLTASLATSQMDVTVDGPNAKLSGMTASDVRIRVDLSGLGPGTHEVTPEVTVPQGVTWVSNTPTAIEVTISEGSGPTTPATPPASRAVAPPDAAP